MANKKGIEKKYRHDKLCIEFEGKASFCEYDPDNNLIHEQPIDPQVICYSIRQMLIEALDMYLKHHEAQDEAEETED